MARREVAARGGGGRQRRERRLNLHRAMDGGTRAEEAWHRQAEGVSGAMDETMGDDKDGGGGENGGGRCGGDLP